MSLEGNLVPQSPPIAVTTSATPPQDRIVLVEGHGVEGDAHAGALVGTPISLVANRAYPSSGRFT
ncbi:MULTISPECIES: hypothetical protein [unclassified Bradyrhizobium]|uniref:hypothetical protein n=1 Tax=unclassified Bradyrhizobium TaxID=2631580 RepID=UPI001FFB4A73|nr:MULTISPECIES: hypothetical protein [unclassified Bradyrhizobium]